MLIGIIAIVSSLFISANALFWQVAILGFIFGLIYISSLSIMFGKLASWTNDIKERFAWGLLFSLASASLIGAILFYLSSWDKSMIIGFTIFLPIAVFIITKDKINSTESDPNYFIARSTLFVVSVLMLFAYLYLNPITQAVRTPWNILMPNALILYALVILSFIYLAKKSIEIVWLILLGIATWSLLNISFPLTFGFDPWIHQATEKILDTTGTISPKPFYYVGQYSLVVWLKTIINLPIILIDRWLIIIAGSIAWALTFYNISKTFISDKRWLILISSTSLVFTWPIFTTTNPHHLSLMWSLLTIGLLAIKNKYLVPWWIIFAFGLCALFTHPLIGIPVILSLFIFWYSERKGQSAFIKITSILALFLAIPLAFLVLGNFGTTALSAQLHNNFISGLESIGSSFTASVRWKSYINLPDLIYLAVNFLPLIFLALATWGFIKIKNLEPYWKMFVLVFSVLTLSYVLMKLFFTFPTLPINEQGFYTERLWQLGLLWLWPLVMMAIYSIWQRVSAGGAGNQAKLQIFLAFGLIAGFYITYPRHDTYHKDTGYNTTPADIEAVNLINQDAGNVKYIVLANQAVSAAALNEFGFNKYYKNNFYYPLPTGSNPLYQVYLEAMEKNGPYKNVVEKAASISGVNVVYLIINNYWADSEKLMKIATENSANTFSTADKSVNVFRYNY